MIARTLATAALLATTAATVAQADCPTAPGDLAAGLRATVEGGFDMILHRTDNGQIETNMFADEPMASLSYSDRGVLVQRYFALDADGDIDPDTIFTVAYDGPSGQPDIAELVAEGEGWFGTVVQTAPSGETIAWGESLSVSPQAEPMALGDCVYEVRVIEQFTGLPGRPGDVNRYAFIPSLDAAVYLDTQLVVDRYEPLPELPAVTRFETLSAD